MSKDAKGHGSNSRHEAAYAATQTHFRKYADAMWAMKEGKTTASEVKAHQKAYGDALAKYAELDLSKRTAKAPRNT